MIKDKTQKGTLPDEELDSLLGFIDTSNWRESFEKLDLPVLQSKRDWFVNTGRGDYYKSLMNGEDKTVLDIGAGAGVISESLSRSFKKVYSIEYNSKWVRFLSKRFRQDKMCNIVPVRANALKLPCRKESFDLVVVNGVLEWVGDFTTEGNIEEIQLNFLKDILKVLKKGGKIGIAIENRFYLRWFLGESPHGEPPYVAILPRFLANYVCKKQNGKEYRNYIYGYRGYKNMLKKAGFENIEIKLAVPNYYEPELVVNLDKQSQQKYFENFSINQSKNRYLKCITKMLLRFGLLGYFEHSFYISAERQ